MEDKKVIEYGSHVRYDFKGKDGYGGYYQDFDAPCLSMGSAVDSVSIRDDGTMWIGNSEYITQVNFNPFTGEPAPVQLPLQPFLENRIKSVTSKIECRDKEQFLKYTGLTEDQFYGRAEIEGWLDLDDLAYIPEGFNPTVGRSLYLNGLTSIPEGFNPTTGWSLYLNGLTFVPEGFSPTVGGNLFLNGLTSIPDGFNPIVGWSLYLNGLTSIPEGFNPTNVKGVVY